MNLTWTNTAWKEYVEWQDIDRKMVRKINELIKECLRTPFEGIGKPEPLKNELSGYWSRRITAEHRLIYEITKDSICKIQCKYHY